MDIDEFLELEAGDTVVLCDGDFVTVDTISAGYYVGKLWVDATLGYLDEEGEIMSCTIEDVLERAPNQL